MTTTAMMNYELYADAIVSVREGQRQHAIVVTPVEADGDWLANLTNPEYCQPVGKTSMVWTDDHSKALPEDVAAELSRVDRAAEAVAETFRMDLAETLADEFGVTPEVATMLVRQVDVFAEDSYECIIGQEEDAFYWKHLARRASELAEIVVFALNENKEESA